MSTPTPAVSAVLGHYRIIEKIGAGGMGVVYRARDEHLHRDVAIKVLPTGSVADDLARRHFRKEAEALSRLDSARIARIYDFDTQDGVDFLVMEYIAGPDLAELIARGPLPEEQIVSLGLQLAEGLRDAHTQGVIHRDIKPTNVRLTPDGRLKVLDFGVTKLLTTPDASTETFATGTQVVGTLAYMAPEQLEGRPADARTDVFAAGLVLYEMAVGRPAYPSTTAPVLIDCILHQPPPSLCKLRPRLNRRLEEITLKCLEKSPAERYQTAGELLADLHSAAANAAPSPLAAALHTGLQTTRRILRALRRLRLSVPAAVVIAAAVTAFWLFGSRPALSMSPNDAILIADFDNQTGDAGLGTSLQTAFTVSLQQSTRSNLVPRSRAQDALRRMGKTGLTRIDESLGREICLRENVRGLLGVTLLKVGTRYMVSARLVDPNTGDVARAFVQRADSEDRLLDAVGAIAEDVRQGLGESLFSIQKRNRPLPEVTTPSMAALKAYSEGATLWYTGRYQEAVQLYESAVEQDPDFAMAHEALAVAYYSYIYNDVVRGKQHCDRSLALGNRTTEHERMVIQCSCAGVQGHVEEAVQAYRALLQVYPNDAASRYNFAGLLRAAQRHQEAIEQLQETLRLHPNNPNALINIATSNLSLGKIPDALNFYAQAFAIEPRWVTNANIAREYGFALIQNGDEAKAVAMFQRGLETPSARAHSQRSLALLDFYHGRYRSGVKWLQAAVVSNRVDNDALGEARNHLLLAIGHRARGEPPAALNELAQAEKLLERVPPNVWLTARLGTECARLGALDRANLILRRITKIMDQGNRGNRGDFHRVQGEIELARHNYGGAAELFQLAEQENPLALALGGLAAAKQASGDSAGAIAAYSDLIDRAGLVLGWEAQQSWTEAHYSAALLYAARGEKASATALLDKLLGRWRDADPDLPLLRDARRLRATLG